MAGFLVRSNIEPLVATRRKAEQFEGVLPICTFCKVLRREGHDEEDDDHWIGMEEQVRDRSEARSSYGICPRCLKRHYPDLAT